MLLVDRQTVLTLSEDDFQLWASSQRVFVSSTINDMREERQATRAAIEATGAIPVMWELVTPAEQRAAETYKAGVLGSDIYLLILKERYGQRLQSGYSATEEEYETAKAAGKTILIWTKDGVLSSQREGQLNRWIADLQQFHSIGLYTNPDELAFKVDQALRRLAVEDTYGWARLEDAIFPYEEVTESPGFDQTVDIEIRFRTRDAAISSYIDSLLTDRMTERVLTVDGRTLLVRTEDSKRHKQRTETSYWIRMKARLPDPNYITYFSSFGHSGGTYSCTDVIEAVVRATLFRDKCPALALAHVSVPTVEFAKILAQDLELTRKLRAIELIACESVCKEGFLRRCDVKAIMRNGRVVLQVRGEVAGDRWTADHVSEISTSGEIA